MRPGLILRYTPVVFVLCLMLLLSACNESSTGDSDQEEDSKTAKLWTNQDMAAAVADVEQRLREKMTQKLMTVSNGEFDLSQDTEDIRIGLFLFREFLAGYAKQLAYAGGMDPKTAAENAGNIFYYSIGKTLTFAATFMPVDEPEIKRELDSLKTEIAGMEQSLESGLKEAGISLENLDREVDKMVSKVFEEIGQLMLKTSGQDMTATPQLAMAKNHSKKLLRYAAGLIMIHSDLNPQKAAEVTMDSLKGTYGLGILAAVGIPKYASVQTQARQNALKGALAAGTSQLEITHAEMVINGETDFSALCNRANESLHQSEGVTIHIEGDGDTCTVTASRDKYSQAETWERPE